MWHVILRDFDLPGPEGSADPAEERLLRASLAQQAGVESIGGPRGARTRDLLIAKEPGGEPEKVPEGLSGPQPKKPDEDETG